MKSARGSLYQEAPSSTTIQLAFYLLVVAAKQTTDSIQIVTLKKWKKLAMYRNAGLSLEAISYLLKNDSSDINTALEKRLSSINTEIHSLREQQRFILKILKSDGQQKNTRVITANGMDPSHFKMAS